MQIGHDLDRRFPGHGTFTFGDSAALSGRLLALVRSGAKTATCDALRNALLAGEDMPRLGGYDVVLDWSGVPALVVQTTEVTVLRFCDVEADFALAEGENDSLQGWRDDHRAYFERNGGWSPEMELVCERFKLIEDLA